MDYSNEQLKKFLSISNKKLKNTKHKIKEVRIQRNDLQSKLDEIDMLLKNTTNYYSKYDNPSDREWHHLQGKLDLKEEILEILSR